MFINLQNIAPLERQHWLQHAIAPRPICFASTVDNEGNVNLSPFSFFNLFSIEPPIVIFSPSRKLRDNTTKHTLQNAMEVPEVTINICDYEMVQQLSLASCEFAKDVNEFQKAGFTMETSTMVKPPMVKEAKIKFECEVMQIKPLGANGGAGNLVICKLLYMHVSDEILNESSAMIDQQKMQHVARLGGDWYSVVNSANLFKVNKPTTQIAIGIDALPEAIRHSKVLTGNDLAMLAGVTSFPVKDEGFMDARIESLLNAERLNRQQLVHEYVKELLLENKIAEAWQVLLGCEH